MFRFGRVVPESNDRKRLMFGGDWPADPRLDSFRDAVWELRLDREMVAYVTTQVGRMRSFPRLWARDEQLWYQIHWCDKRHDNLAEDYGLVWPVVEEFESGRFAYWHGDGSEIEYDTCPVEPELCQELWDRYGPPA